MAADEQGIDEAWVCLAVQVNSQGKVEKVQVIKDPEMGFGANAIQCARQRRFLQAIDIQGKPLGD